MQMTESGKRILPATGEAVHMLWPVSALAAVLGLVAAGAFASGGPDGAHPDPVRRVVQQLSQKEVTRIEIFYFDWGASVYGGMDRDRLLSDFQYKVIVANPRSNIDELQQALSRMRFHRVDSQAPEFRIACVFYVGSKEVLRMFFADNVPVVSVGKELFKVEPDLLSAVAALLPHEAYERMHRSILARWTYSYQEKH